MKRAMMAMLAMLVLLACNRGNIHGTSRSASYGDAELFSSFAYEWRNGHTSRAHILFVPQFDIPSNKMRGSGTGSGGTAREWDVQCDFSWSGEKVNCDKLTVVDYEMLDARGRRYDLTHGNVFVAHVETTGAIRLEQLPEVVNDEPPLDSLMATIKRALPSDARVQALPDRAGPSVVSRLKT